MKLGYIHGLVAAHVEPKDRRQAQLAATRKITPRKSEAPRDCTPSFARHDHWRWSSRLANDRHATGVQPNLFTYFEVS